jgi:hypothetical protein
VNLLINWAIISFSGRILLHGINDLVSGYCYRLYRTKRPMYCDHFCSVVRLHLSYNLPCFIHHSSLVAIKTPSSEAGELAKMSLNLDEKIALSYCAGILTCFKIFRHVTDGFISLPKEVVLRFLSPLRVHRPRPGLNPANLGCNGKHDNHNTTENDNESVSFICLNSFSVVFQSYFTFKLSVYLWQIVYAHRSTAHF